MRKWVPLAELEAQTGVPVRTLQHIKANEPGVLVYRQAKSRGGRPADEYAQPDCAIALRKREADKVRKAAPPENAVAANLRRLNAEADRAEIEVQRLRGELIPRADAVRETGVFLDRLRGKLLGFPGRWAPTVFGLKTLPEVQAALEAGVHDAMVELSGRDGD